MANSPPATLVVVRPFRSYTIGQHVTDVAEVAEILASENASAAVAVAVSAPSAAPSNTQQV